MTSPDASRRRLRRTTIAASGKIHVPPPEAEQLALAKPRKSSGLDERPVAVRDRVREPVQLRHGHKPLLGRVLDTATSDSARVPRDAVVVDGRREDLPEPGVRLGGDRRASAGDERRVPLADELRRQFRERSDTEGGHRGIRDREDVEP